MLALDKGRYACTPNTPTPSATSMVTKVRDSYVRVAMNEVFGGSNFINEITSSRTSGRVSARARSGTWN